MSWGHPPQPVPLIPADPNWMLAPMHAAKPLEPVLTNAASSKLGESPVRARQLASLNRAQSMAMNMRRAAENAEEAERRAEEAEAKRVARVAHFGQVSERRQRMMGERQERLEAQQALERRRRAGEKELGARWCESHQYARRQAFEENDWVVRSSLFDLEPPARDQARSAAVLTRLVQKEQRRQSHLHKVRSISQVEDECPWHRVGTRRARAMAERQVAEAEEVEWQRARQAARDDRLLQWSASQPALPRGGPGNLEAHHRAMVSHKLHLEALARKRFDKSRK